MTDETTEPTHYVGILNDGEGLIWGTRDVPFNPHPSYSGQPFEYLTLHQPGPGDGRELNWKRERGQQDSEEVIYYALVEDGHPRRDPAMTLRLLPM